MAGQKFEEAALGTLRSRLLRALPSQCRGKGTVRTSLLGTAGGQERMKQLRKGPKAPNPSPGLSSLLPPLPLLGTPRGQHPRDPIPSPTSRASPTHPPSSPTITGTLIPTSPSAEAAFSCLLKINEADNDSAGAPGPDVSRSALGSGWRSENQKLAAALSSVSAGLFVHSHS